MEVLKNGEVDAKKSTAGNRLYAVADVLIRVVREADIPEKADRKIQLQKRACSPF